MRIEFTAAVFATCTNAHDRPSAAHIPAALCCYRIVHALDIVSGKCCPQPVMNKYLIVGSAAFVLMQSALSQDAVPNTFERRVDTGLEAIAEQVKRQGGGSVGSPNTIRWLATVYRDHGDLEMARPLYYLALAAQQTSWTADPDITADILRDLALLCLAKKQFADAARYQSRALTLWATAPNPNADAHTSSYRSGAIMRSLSDFATAYIKEGLYDNADQMMDQMMRNWNGLDPVSFERCCSDGILNQPWEFRKKGQFPRSERLLKKLLATKMAILGSDHRHLVRDFNELARHFVATGQYDEAEKNFLRAIAIADTTETEHARTGAAALLGLAKMYRDTGRDREANSIDERVSILCHRVSRNIRETPHWKRICGDQPREPKEQ